MKITDLKCAIIGTSPVVRIVTDEGIDGYGQGGYTKPFLKPFVEYFRDQLIGADPTDVERTMLRIRQRGSFKPYGTALSIIENALWDIAGKAAGVPVYKLLGGKVRDRVATYNGNLRSPIAENSPEAYADAMRTMKALPHNFRLVKQGVAFHSQMKYEPGFYFGTPQPKVSHGILDRGLLTHQGMSHVVECVTAMKEVLGDDVMLALDCGPGMMPTDVVRLSEELEHLNITWLEDTVTGDYTPYVLADVLRDVTRKSRIPIHTGEQIYLRQHFRELIETRAVDIIGPDPADVGGMAEMKWIAEYADLHGILIAPHGTGNGLLGLACQVQVGATMPANFIAFEYPTGNPDWWYDIVDGLPDPIVVDGEVEVMERPGMGIELIPEAAKKYLREEDQGFFD